MDGVIEMQLYEYWKHISAPLQKLCRLYDSLPHSVWSPAQSAQFPMALAPCAHQLIGSDNCLERGGWLDGGRLFPRGLPKIVAAAAAAPWHGQ